MNDATSLQRRCLPWMLALAALFAARVLAQALQWAGPVPFLPPFDAWQGSGLPYPALLTSQLVIVALLAWALLAVRAESLRPGLWKRRACFALGGAYFAAMALRLAAGLTFLAHVEWFAQTLPSLFHLALAAFVLLLGRCLSDTNERAGDAA